MKKLGCALMALTILLSTLAFSGCKENVDPEAVKQEWLEKSKDMKQLFSDSKTVTDKALGGFDKGTEIFISPYEIGRYPVTQVLYEDVMGVNPSEFKSDPASGEIQEMRPVDNINWYRAIAFCNKLSLRDGYDLCYSVKDADGNEIDWANLNHDDIPASNENDANWAAAECDMSKRGYRLPTKVEWEFAARDALWYPEEWEYEYIGTNTLSDVAWYSGNSDSKTHEVGKKNQSVGWYYDMCGNVWEWCNDGAKNITPDGKVIDPVGVVEDSKRVLKGGSYKDDESSCAVAFQNSSNQAICDSSFGFRLARSGYWWKDLHDKAVSSVKEHEETVAKYAAESKEMITVITKSTTITGDQKYGVFKNGRTVTLSPYSMGKYLVTQALYESVMGTNPSAFNKDPADGEIQEMRPVERVNWYRAIAFCNKLSLKENYQLCYSVKDVNENEIDWKNLKHSDIPTVQNADWDAAVVFLDNNGYRLPTEAEWLFAAKGGNQKAEDWNFTYSGSNTLDEVAWYYPISDSITHQVGTKKANRLGIYDMSGNLDEICNDGLNDIKAETVTDPLSEPRGSSRVRCGGSFMAQDTTYFEVSGYSRYQTDSYSCDKYQGFRLVRSLTK